MSLTVLFIVNSKFFFTNLNSKQIWKKEIEKRKKKKMLKKKEDGDGDGDVLMVSWDDDDEGCEE